MTSVTAGVSWADPLETRLREAAANGWVLAFLSANSARSRYVQIEIELGMHLGAKFVPILLERVTLPPRLSSLQAFDAFTDFATAPARLAELLLLRS
jgi:hypothetical protein